MRLVQDSAAVRGLRLGLIAPEFPPDLGGMENLARGLADALAATDDVTVFTFPRTGTTTRARFRLAPVLTGALRADARVLGRHERDLDAWLALNAGVMPLARRLAKPGFVYLHGNDFLKPWIGYGSWWMEGIRKPYMGVVRHAVRRRALRRAGRVVRHAFTNSRRTAELASERLGFDTEHITVCPPGVDDRFFQPHEGIPNGTLRLLTVARLTKYSARKNIDGVLTAIASLRGTVPIHYTIVGDGDDRPRLEELARRLGLSDAVSFAGALATEDLIACYRRADAFILAAKATRDDVEGFGIVYLEASASGVPVICSREGGAVDAVEPGRNGVVLPSSSPADIATGIIEFARARSRYHADSVRAFAENYRWPRVAARLRSQIAAALQSDIDTIATARSPRGHAGSEVQL